MKLPLTLKIALPIAIIATGIIFFAYVAVQQDYRQSANDPQLQLANDAWGALGRGEKTPEQAVGTSTVDLSYSLSPFVTVYDVNHRPLATSGRFGDQTLTPPPGTFDYAKNHGRNTFTWEPAVGGRYAAVLQYYGGGNPGFVLSARSLYDVEQRESWLTTMAALALAATYVVLLGLVLFVH